MWQYEKVFTKYCTTDIWHWLDCTDVLGVPDTCWHCGMAGSESDFFLIWWYCTKINSFWRRIGREIQKILGTKVPFNLMFFLLQDFWNWGKGGNYSVMVTSLLSSSSILVAGLWKMLHVPTMEVWIGRARCFWWWNYLQFWNTSWAINPIQQFSQQWSPFVIVIIINWVLLKCGSYWIVYKIMVFFIEYCWLQM